MSQINVNTIANVSGTTAITVDSSGRVTTPARPAFRVTGVLNGWTSFSSNTKVNLLTTVDYNIGNHYSTTNYEFTAPVAGLYHFSGRFYVNNTATISSYFISIDDASFTNTLYFASQDADQSDSSVTFAETLQLTANQTVSIKGNNGQYYPLWSGFSGYFIG